MSIVDAQDQESLKRHAILILEMILAKIRNDVPCAMVVGFADGEVAIGSAYAAPNATVYMLTSASGLSEIGKSSALASCLVAMQTDPRGFIRPVE